MKTLAVTGDVEAARVASDAIARLLGNSASGARVVHVEVARRRREE